MNFDRTSPRKSQNPRRDETDRDFRPHRAPRRKTAWELQAETWRGPEQHFSCCGTTYSAMSPAELDLMKQTHKGRCAMVARGGY